MSVVRERLRALQRQSGRTPGSGGERPGGIGATGDNVRSQLQRLLARRARRPPRTLAAPAGSAVADGLRLVETRWPVAASARVRLPLREPVEVARERVVCFDTETTGLAGGVGTKAFMIGSAQWCAHELVVRQWYLTALRGEDAMLRAFAAALPEQAIFVSYNGRSYDAPLLKGRYRMHRQAHPFEAREHVDLLHPVRRAYRGLWENCRLQTVERRLLDVVRDDDLPGRDAPAAWLAYLRGESSTNLARVLAHNRQDVRTLALLLDRLAETSAPHEAIAHGRARHASGRTAGTIDEPRPISCARPQNPDPGNEQ